ncbi:MAG TPA: flagellar hook-basal body complex protein FliE [Symbiobacteriaceae bacterium]|nr:flagellar hook-basal body complex protein FliE [Symbiobacteriaceae bacterium]
MNVQRLNALLGMELPIQAPKAEPAEAKPEGASFGNVLAQALSSVEKDQQHAQDMAKKLVTGEIKDVAEVMIASERANLSLGLALQVRNKMLEAYQEIMRMPL